MSREKASLFIYTDGRVQIPKLIRNKLKIKAGDLVTISTENGRIVITPFIKKCMICETENNLSTIEGHSLCIDCIEKIVDVWQKWRF